MEARLEAMGHVGLSTGLGPGFQPLLTSGNEVSLPVRPSVLVTAMGESHDSLIKLSLASI